MKGKDFAFLFIDVEGFSPFTIFRDKQSATWIIWSVISWIIKRIRPVLKVPDSILDCQSRAEELLGRQPESGAIWLLFRASDYGIRMIPYSSPTDYAVTVFGHLRTFHPVTQVNLFSILIYLTGEDGVEWSDCSSQIFELRRNDIQMYV